MAAATDIGIGGDPAKFVLARARLKLPNIARVALNLRFRLLQLYQSFGWKSQSRAPGRRAQGDWDGGDYRRISGFHDCRRYIDHYDFAVMLEFEHGRPVARIENPA